MAPACALTADAVVSLLMTLSECATLAARRAIETASTAAAIGRTPRHGLLMASRSSWRLSYAEWAGASPGRGHCVAASLPVPDSVM